MSRILQWRGHPWVSLPVRLYIGMVFLLACPHKILHPAQFALDVAMYQVLPLELINLQAIVLPWVELFTAVMILVGFRTRAAAALITAMMVMFIVALVIALGHGLEMGCGCFASEGGDDPISWRTVVRDAIWLVMGLYILVFDHDPIGVDRLIGKESEDG
ncbi:MAG: DoxX family membrane protein [Deltaproteobacteria bacterium]|nr:DoxX family membrane protein [Deltaproteobacteria bacterium]